MLRAMDGRELDRRMRTWAAEQHALVGRDQLRSCGASRQAVANRLRSPDWEALTTRVMRLIGAPVTGEQRAMAAVLDAGDGAVISHAAAAALWGLPGFDLRCIDLRGRGRPPPGPPPWPGSTIPASSPPTTAPRPPGCR